MTKTYDIIVIGSGAAGAHAALCAAEQGASVCIIDGGMEAPPILSEERCENFETMRRHCDDQWRFFLGEDYSGIPVSGMEGGHGGGMTKGNRSYVTSKTEEWLPLQTTNGMVLQSLAQGGLAAAWGGACAYMPENDLIAMGLQPDVINPAYDAIAAIIGISGQEDRPHVQPPLPLDHHAERALCRALQKQDAFAAMQLRLMQPCSAILTKDLGARKATALQDMDYYIDPGHSLYRPQYTIEHLRTLPNVTYKSGRIAKLIEETPDSATVFATCMHDPANLERYTGTSVILAAGAVNTARILLQSTAQWNVAVPFIAKPHAYAACLDTGSIGRKGPAARSSVCQLVLLDEARSSAHTESACAQLYSYRSLLLFRLLSSIPLPVPQAMQILQLLSPSLVIADIRFPALRDDGHTLQVTQTQSGNAKVDIRCKDSRDAARLQSLKRIQKGLRMADLLPAKTLWMPEGSSSHYAGTVPIDDNPALPLCCDTHGKVRQMRHVYVADAAAFRMLPPLPHTFTIMAYARTVAHYAVHRKG